MLHPVTLAMANEPFEKVYHIATPNAFKTVSGAVFYALSLSSPGGQIEPQVVEGGARYVLQTPGGVFAHLFVLHVTDHTAVVRLHVIPPTDELQFLSWQLKGQETVRLFAGLLDFINSRVVGLLQRAARAEGQDPPPPPATDLDAVLSWAEVYRPQMTDKELAALIGVSHGTLRNARSRLEAPKRAVSKEAKRGKR